MSTAKTRINISLPDEVKEALTRLARRDQVPESTKAARLLEIGLELEEDLAWDEIAVRRDTAGARFVPYAQVFKL